jgi:class 3 adenylate cyclase
VVTFLFIDIEGSTRLLQELGQGSLRPGADDHIGIRRRRIAGGKGTVVRTEGDGLFAVFPAPSAPSTRLSPRNGTSPPTAKRTAEKAPPRLDEGSNVVPASVTPAKK